MVECSFMNLVVVGSSPVGYVYDLSIDYDAITVDDILDIHKYLIKKNGIECLGLLKKCCSNVIF